MLSSVCCLYCATGAPSICFPCYGYRIIVLFGHPANHSQLQYWSGPSLHMSTLRKENNKSQGRGRPAPAPGHLAPYFNEFPAHSGIASLRELYSVQRSNRPNSFSLCYQTDRERERERERGELLMRSGWCWEPDLARNAGKLSGCILSLARPSQGPARAHQSVCLSPVKIDSWRVKRLILFNISSIVAL